MRVRDVLALLVGLVVVAGVGLGVWTWLGDTIDETADPVSDPMDTATRYLAAWEDGDHAAMAELVREPPEDFASRHAQLEEVLEPTDVTLTAGDMDSEVEGRARIPVSVAVDAAFATEPVTWDTELELVRAQGEWRVAYSTQTIHPELRESWVFATASEPVERADILATDGTVLAGRTDLVTFGFEPTAVEDPDEVVEAFDDALPGSGDDARRELDRGDLVDGWFYPVVTVSRERADEAAPRLRRASGVLRRTGQGRALYEQNFARHIVGVIDEATAEQLEELGEEAEPGTEIAQFGLERALDDELTGSELVRVGLREGDGDDDAPLQVVLAEVQADPSGPVSTTLDVTVQEAIEQALAEVDGPAAIVAVEVGDGAIRGSASRPLSGYNRAFEGRYPPGSTFKTVTAEALLADDVTPEASFDCPAETTVGGLSISNAGGTGHGEVTLREAFALSCNTTFATLAADLGTPAVTAAAERFGFGTSPELPLSAFGSSFPEPADTAELGAAAFGQARVEASVLHLASVAAAAASGQWFPPYLLEEDGPGEPRALTDGVVEPLTDMLRAVVTEGTGSEADVGDFPVIGKTGTAQAPDGIEHAWFIGAYEDVGFAVLVEEGGSGAQVAAPLAARFVAALAELRTAEDTAGDTAEDER